MASSLDLYYSLLKFKDILIIITYQSYSSDLVLYYKSIPPSPLSNQTDKYKDFLLIPRGIIKNFEILANQFNFGRNFNILQEFTIFYNKISY